MDQRRDTTDVGGMSETPNMRSTAAAITPQQMRQMAVTHFPTAGPREREIIAVLRSAADQLEAVERWLWLQNGHLPGAAIEDLSAILTADTAPRKASVVDAILEASRLQLAVEECADTAPQENRMSKCDWPECPGRPKSVEKHEIESGPELHPQCKDAILLAERARREGWHTAPQQDRDE
ncbi:hypothetical protein KK103_12060 [Curtobacterium flaccumfaciens pv. flaccumfaciens]|uniref:Uncharacterized protein n=2 Tax=Curtobacterium flaccumfaciens TaxID=2035 RepID=A0A9Q2W4Y8_9MICO|nr:hypothetical protein [Curtobacterium flaccumfaciens pv. flaccumfaciens]